MNFLLKKHRRNSRLNEFIKFNFQFYNKILVWCHLFVQPSETKKLKVHTRKQNPEFTIICHRSTKEQLLVSSSDPRRSHTQELNSLALVFSAKIEQNCSLFGAAVSRPI
ncbi:hypothetical protein BpHYR1_042218 [Brachionus plicatilis]|uniref:Uncharacterized protein n=1 Tax=Brachionus plicatilis TaxID=10195 RepID=A0A3M7P2P2_BRAPC|nr:hypothetical protein BpHYR1_042218 [Brachionus plicatilis]